MKKKPKARILIVEDDPAILHGLLDVLVFNGYEAKGVDTGDRGLTVALEENFDLIVLDLMLPNLDGYSICKAVRSKKPDQGILMLTAKGSENDVVKGFKAGADDYVSKPFSIRELMVRLEAVLRRIGKNLGDEDIVFNGILFSAKTLMISCNEQSVEITRKEMDIIAYLYRHMDRIVSKKELLTEVWNYIDADIETRTVDIHMLKLRKKITKMTNNPFFIKTIRGEGYRLEPEK